MQRDEVGSPDGQAPASWIDANWLKGVGEVLAWTLLYLASRLLLLAIASPGIYSQDELYNGAAAFEIAAGRGLPLPLMAHAAYCGGPILLALIAPHLFATFGANMFALRLPSVVTSTLVCLLWLLITRRLFGRAVVNLAGPLFVLSPPFYSLLTVIAWANHAESNLLTATTLFCLVNLYGRIGAIDASVATSRVREVAYGVMMGATATLALFLSLASVVTSAVAAIAIAVAGRRGIARPATRAALVGAALGAVPAIVLSAAWQAHGIRGLLSFTRPGLADPARRLAGLVLSDSRFYLAPHLGLPRAVEAIFWFAALGAVSWAGWQLVRHLRPGRPVPASLLLAGPPLLFALVFAVSTFPMGPRAMGFMGYRYLVLVTPSVLVAIAVAVARLPRGRRQVLLLLVAPQLIATAIRLPQLSRFVIDQKPSSYFAYAIKVFETLDYDLAQALPVLEPITVENDRAAALAGVGLRHVTHHLSQYDGPPVAALIAYLRGPLVDVNEHRQVFIERLAYLHTYPGRLRLTLTEFEQLAAVVDERDRDGELAPLASVMVVALDDAAADASTIDAALRALPSRLRSAGAHGVGMLSARRLCSGRAMVAWLPTDEDRSSYFSGLGFEVARRKLVERGQNPCSLPADGDHAAMQTGADAMLRLFEPEDAVRRRMLGKIVAAGSP